MSVGSDQQTYQRATQAAIVGLAIQLTLALVVAVLGIYSRNPALTTSTWFILGGIPIWFILLLIFHQHRLERLEALEAEQLSKDKSAANIFDTAADDLALARRRLAALEKYGLNTVSFVTAWYLLSIGLWKTLEAWRMFNTPTQEGESSRLFDHVLPAHADGTAANPILLMAVTGGITFVLFVVARYISGMTQVQQWKLLRGGASYLMGNFVAMGLIFVAFTAISVLDYSVMLAWLGLIIPILMVVAGLDMLTAMLLGLYRPRRPGEVPRPGFDSRIFGLLSSPKSLGQIINETINYQFGFEVSKSWFYRLLAQAITPLVVFGLIIMLAISCIVVVQPHEQAVVLRFGRMVGEPIGPGLSWKAPWPISTVVRHEVGRVQELHVGSVVRAEAHRPGGAILWTNEHTEGEEQFLLSAPTPLVEALREAEEQEGDEVAAGASLVAAEIVLQYEISDLGAYLRSARDPRALLKSIADRRVSEYFAARDIDSLLTAVRHDATEALRTRIQADCDAPGLNMGIRVLVVAVLNIHPPQKDGVAEAFHEEINAQQEMEQMIREAQRDAIEVLARLAGSYERALRIDEAIRHLNQLDDQRDRARDAGDASLAELDEQVRAQNQVIEDMLNVARGQAATRIYAARALRWQTDLREKAAARQFEADLIAYRHAPRYFLAERYFAALVEGLARTRKYIVSADVEEPTVRINLQEAAGLGGFLQQE